MDINFDDDELDDDDVTGGYVIHDGGDDCMSFIIPKCSTCPADTMVVQATSNRESSIPRQADEWWEDVVVKNDANYANTKRALEITERFIGDNDLILIGGMAIDMALKVVGKAGIYSADKLPDYDFLTTDTARDATKLAFQLCKAHLPNVSAINAMHTTTIRVRCNFADSADIGYCPSGIYNELPTLKIGRLRVIHPHFQIIDIHRSLSYPFDRAQVIGAGLFYRWKKDCLRYDLLLDAYPIKCESTNCSVKMIRILLDKELLAGDCLAGWCAISYWKSSSQRSLSDQMNVSEFEIPEGESIQVFTDNFAKYVSRADIADSNSIGYFEAIMGHLPRHVKLTIAGQKYEVFDSFGTLLSAEKIPEAKQGQSAMYVSNIQHCMLWLIENIYISARGASDQLKSFCHKEYSECTKLVTSGDRPGLLPSINVFGSANLDESYLIGRRKFVARLSGTKLHEKDVIDGVYPAEPKCSSKISFDYDKSPYFAISGAKCGAFVKHEVPSIG